MPLWHAGQARARWWLLAFWKGALTALAGDSSISANAVIYF